MNDTQLDQAYETYRAAAQSMGVAAAEVYMFRLAEANGLSYTPEDILRWTDRFLGVSR